MYQQLVNGLDVRSLSRRFILLLKRTARVTDQDI